MKTRAITLFAVLASLYLVSTQAVQAVQAEDPPFPCTAEQDADGACFVWYITNIQGESFRRPYEPCKDIPKSSFYRKVTDPQAGDVVWWPKFMALYDPSRGKDSNVIAFGRALSRDELEKKYGKPQFFRIQVSTN
jgi:hypothetical protein